MKMISKSMFCAQIAAVLLTATLNSYASEEGVPLRGTLRGGETYEFEGSTLLSHGTGVGNSSHLGYYTVTWETVSEPSAPVNAGATTFHFVAANGDSLFVEAPGLAEGEFPIFHIQETGTITGGTGRFLGATGTVLLERDLIVTGPDTGISTASFEGVIRLAHAK